jgi:uncharacterized protein YecT (DUF1311 family)
MGRKILIQIFIIFLIVIWKQTANAREPCLYCGVWVQYGGIYETYTSSNRLIITDNSISLPGCAATYYSQVYLTNKIGYGGNESIDPRELKSILKVDNTDNCSFLANNPGRYSLLEIVTRPLGFPNSERLNLVIFHPTTIDDIKASYTYELVPTPKGQKQMMKHPPRPKELAHEAFIRELYNPCEEGGAGGTWICASMAYKKADESMNAEWNDLMNLIKGKEKKKLILLQNKWKKECQSNCAKAFGVGGAFQFQNAHNEFCLADGRGKRAEQIKLLAECIRSKNNNCGTLTDYICEVAY